jgi:hypothetical protein
MAPAPNLPEGDERQLFETLQKESGRANNGTLQGMLGWESNRYWEARNRLLDKGFVRKAHGGPGGTTFITDQLIPQIVEAIPADVIPASQQLEPYPDEGSLYGPLMEQIEQNWARSEAYDGFIVANTARLGRRQTGGNWTRPDICLIGIRKFKFIPNPVMDVVTFEVKPKSDVTVKAILEALSHRQASTLAYVIFNISKDEFESNQENERIAELAKNHGVGIILAAKPNDQKTWVEEVGARRWEPNPEDLNEFIQEVIPEEKHEEIIKMFK